MEKNLISVLIKHPYHPATRKTIKNDLATLQRIVGGYVESVTVTSDIVILCDEEGAIKGLPFNVELCDCEFCGPLIILGSSGDEFASLSLDVEKSLRTLIPQLFEPCQNMYHSTAISVALNERDANKLANLIAALTGQEAILVTYHHEENGHGHTHIFASTGPVGDAEKEEVNHWINKHGGTVYRKLPSDEVNHEY